MVRRFAASVAVALPLGVGGVASLASAPAAHAECPRSPDVVALVTRGDQSLATNLDGAISDYEAASKLTPKDPRVLWKLARAYQKKESWELAVPVLYRASALDPGQAEYAWLRGYAQSRLAEKGAASWADARASLESAIALDPNWDEPEIDLAEVLLHLGDDAGAIAHLTKAIRKQPDRASTYANLGDLYVRLGFLDHAEKVLRAGVAFDKDGSGGFLLHGLLAQVMEAKHDPRELAENEAARAACGECNERGQQIIFFNLGMSYANAKPPRKVEARESLLKFEKMICRGAAAARYVDECAQAQQVLQTLAP